MENACGNRAYRGCPASFYTKCRGYREGLSCLEFSDKPCCKNNDLSTCVQCKVYSRCHSELNSYGLGG